MSKDSVDVLGNTCVDCSNGCCQVPLVITPAILCPTMYQNGPLSCPTRLPKPGASFPEHCKTWGGAGTRWRAGRGMKGTPWGLSVGSIGIKGLLRVPDFFILRGSVLQLSARPLPLILVMLSFLHAKSSNKSCYLPRSGSR